MSRPRIQPGLITLALAVACVAPADLHGQILGGSSLSSSSATIYQPIVSSPLQTTSSSSPAPPSQTSWGTLVPGRYPYRYEGEQSGEDLFVISGALDLEFQVTNYQSATSRPSRAVVQCFLCPDGNCSDPIGPAAHVFDIASVPSGNVGFYGIFQSLDPELNPYRITAYQCDLFFASDKDPYTPVIPGEKASEWWARTSAQATPPVVTIRGPIG